MYETKRCGQPSRQFSPAVQIKIPKYTYSYISPMIYSHKMADFEGHFNLLWSHIISRGKQFRSFKSSLHVAQIRLQNGKHFHTAQ